MADPGFPRGDTIIFVIIEQGRPRSATIMSMKSCQEIKILLTCSWLRHVRLSSLTA